MTADRSDSRQVLDQETIAGLRQLQSPGEPDVLTDLVGTYIEDSDRRIVAIRTAYQEGKPTEVERGAHGLAGGSVVFGADALVAACRELQQAGLDGDLDRMPPLIGALEREYERVQSALLHQVEQGS